MQVLKEWFIPAPWGKIASISWGNPTGDSILLVHGRQDSVVTFEPLLKLLPDKYHYVAFDLPGHGKSDPLPAGVRLMRLHFLAAIDVVVKHLQWNYFMYIAHSLGAELGLFYNAVNPNRIKKFVLLDPGPSLVRSQMQGYSNFYKMFYDDYYNNYNAYNREKKVYSKRNALSAVMKARGLTEEQAELILSRNLTRVGEDQYTLSWDRILRIPSPLNLPNDYLLGIYSKNAPPTLMVAAKFFLMEEKTEKHGEMRRNAKKLLSDLLKLKNFMVVMVEGGHDVHFTNPERMYEDINTFIEKDFPIIKSKI